MPPKTDQDNKTPGRQAGDKAAAALSLPGLPLATNGRHSTENKDDNAGFDQDPLQSALGMLMNEDEDEEDAEQEFEKLVGPNCTAHACMLAQHLVLDEGVVDKCVVLPNFVLVSHGPALQLCTCSGRCWPQCSRCVHQQQGQQAHSSSTACSMHHVPHGTLTHGKGWLPAQPVHAERATTSTCTAVQLVSQPWPSLGSFCCAMVLGPAGQG